MRFKDLLLSSDDVGTNVLSEVSEDLLSVEGVELLQESQHSHDEHCSIYSNLKKKKGEFIQSKERKLSLSQVPSCWQNPRCSSVSCRRTCSFERWWTRTSKWRNVQWVEWWCRSWRMDRWVLMFPDTLWVRSSVDCLRLDKAWYLGWRSVVGYLSTTMNWPLPMRSISCWTPTCIGSSIVVKFAS